MADWQGFHEYCVSVVVFIVVVFVLLSLHCCCIGVVAVVFVWLLVCQHLFIYWFIQVLSEPPFKAHFSF